MNNLIGKRAILYRRVSTSDQKNYGNSLNQQLRLHDFCRNHSIEIIKDFEEDYSAKDFEKETEEFISFGIHLINNLGELFKTSNVQIKQKLLSSIQNEKLVFEGDKYRTLKLNKGIELIVMNINKLEQIKNKNGRLSFDNIPLSTRGGT